MPSSYEKILSQCFEIYELVYLGRLMERLGKSFALTEGFINIDRTLYLLAR